jgi:hypothetical protein
MKLREFKVSKFGPALAGICLLLLGSCFDPEPARVSVSCTYHGLQRNCDVLLDSIDGRIEQRVSTNLRGIGEFKHLLPGDYQLSFVDGKDKAWPAVRRFSVRSGQVLSLRIELSEVDDPLIAKPAG